MVRAGLAAAQRCQTCLQVVSQAPLCPANKHLKYYGLACALRSNTGKVAENNFKRLL